MPELALLPVGLLAAHAVDSPVPVLAAAVGVVPLLRWRARRRTAEQARRRAAAVIDLCTGLVGELRSGATPEQALHMVMGREAAFRSDLGLEASARLAAAPYGANVPAALRLVAELPGGRGAAALAACWQVGSDSGTGLAHGLDRLADALRAERALAEEIAGELAGCRATTALLAVLPVLALLLGAALGAHPLTTLLHTPAGLGCLAAGVLLEAAGLAWTSRIVRDAEGGPRKRQERAVLSGSCGLTRRRDTRRDPVGSGGRPGHGHAGAER
ncbi:type II secretion system F family protein [Kitasatospora sp. NBC_01539]|uniref:type II secretion system F family protein n=1 Tax=Kitasatospora sp. NBC_01539 TaxID=2903577 RepID=UPI0038600F03